MKKIITSLLSACMLAGAAPVMAEQNVETYGANISVYGKLLEEREGEKINILMYDNDTSLSAAERILHIGSTNVHYGGDYQYKFSYDLPVGKTLDDYTVMARIGTDDVTSSIVSIADTNKAAFEVSVRMDAYYTPEVTIKNKLESAIGAKIIIAAYKSDEELAGVKIIDTNVPFDKEGDGLVVNIEDLGGDYIKAFMWDSEIELLPLATPGTTKRASDTKFKDGDIVTITGSSSVHLSTAPTFIDHFYQTRYPNIDVKVYNTGVGGDRVYMVLDRLNWDVYYGNPNRVYLLCGGNDIGYWEYGAGKEELTQKKLDKVYTTMDNYNRFVDTLTADGKDFTLLGTALMDEGDYEGAVTDDTFYKGANKTIGILNHKIAEFAKENNFKYTDFFNYTTQITNKLRENDPNAQALAKADRVHFTDAGYLVEGALILLGQGNDEVVASVEIDAANAENSVFENADVTVTEATSSKIAYSYAPKAIPLANNAWYAGAEKLYPITEKLNCELIKVANLEDGTYTVKFTDENNTEFILGSYSAEELANGINIAINENNPGQIQSMTAMKKQETRRSKEQGVRDKVAKMVENKTYEDEATMTSFNAGKDAAQAYAAEAKALSVPKTYTVTIEK